MNALVLVAVVVAAQPSRSELVEFIQKHYPPDTYCGTGDPWWPFAEQKFTPETNALLMELSSNAATHDAALALLENQLQDEAVVDFFRRRFTSGVDRQAAAFLLLDTSAEDRDLVLRSFGEHVWFDREVLLRLKASRAKFGLSQEALERFRQLHAQAGEKVSKADLEAGQNFLERAPKSVRNTRLLEEEFQRWRRGHDALLKSEFAPVLDRYK